MSLEHPSTAYMMEHRVNDRALLPGAAMLDSCYSAAMTLLTGSCPLPPCPCQPMYGLCSRCYIARKSFLGLSYE